MTERVRLLEAVAVAADILAHSAGVIRGRHPEDADIYTHELEHIRDLLSALAALDAHQPQPAAGETVEVRAAVIFYSPHDWIVRGAAGWDARDMEEEARGRGRPLSAILTARVPYPAPIPTIDAEVTP